METSNSNSETGYDKYLEEKFILKLLCSNPIHVFQLILASKIIVEDVLPVLMESPSREIIHNPIAIITFQEKIFEISIVVRHSVLQVFTTQTKKSMGFVTFVFQVCIKQIRII